MEWRAARSARAATVLAVLLAGTLTACSSEHQTAAVAPFGSDNVVSVPGTVTPAPPTSKGTVAVKRVAMIGDSITVGSHDQLQKAFTGIGLPDVDINAESGRRMVKASAISSGLDGIAQVMKDGPAPDLWIIALGTNDVANYAPEEYQGAIEQLLGALPPKAHVIWVDCYLQKFKQRSQAFDTVLRQVLTARGNAKIVDWATVAGQDGVLVDGVHPSGYGRDEFSRRVAQTVHDWMS